jgi:predicted ABC-type ATPase
MDNSPILYILAGPNGIGKTTSFYDFVPQNFTFINADDIAKQLREKSGDMNIQEIANGEATSQMNHLIAKKASFGFETNLADNETWKFIEKIQLIGYQIVIDFFCTDTIQTCINRVNNRVKEGGHFVRPDIIKMRYENGLKLLKYYLNIPDLLILTDNSNTPVKFIEMEKGNIVFRKENTPQWIQNVLKKEIEKDNSNKSLEEIKQQYKEQSNK